MKNKQATEIVGRVISAIWFIALLFGVPQIMLRNWDSFEDVCMRMSVKIGGNPQLWMYVIIANATNLITLSVYNLCLYLVYMMKHPFFEQFRIDAEVDVGLWQKPWPWEQDHDKWRKLLKKTLKFVFLNGIIVNMATVFGENLVHELQYTHTVSKWPSTYQLVSHFLIFLISLEIISFFAHWAFHHPTFYQIHKLHHEYSTSISITATYAHPIEYIFSNLLAVAIPIPILSLITEVHFVEIVPWLVFRLIETAQVHCGYEFPWGCITFMPYKNDSGFHDFHHSHNCGNYGSMFIFMDRLFGTDKAYTDFRSKKKMIKNS